MKKKTRFAKTAALVLAVLLCLGACASASDESASSPTAETATSATASKPASSEKADQPEEETAEETDQTVENDSPESTDPTATQPTKPSANIAPVIVPDKVPPMISTAKEAACDLSVRLLQKSYAEDNTLLSPLSILNALSMAMNGAEGNTLAQFESALHMDLDAMNDFVTDFSSDLPDTRDCKLTMANGVWIRDAEDLTVQDAFVNTLTKHYGAAVQTAPFDRSTVHDINNFVTENTGGMIDGVLNDIPEMAMLYLVNALYFDAEWKNFYSASDITDQRFTVLDGSQRMVKMMESKESLYLEDAYATGVMKKYEGDRYAFAALLPKEGIKFGDYVNWLDGVKLHKTLSNPTEVDVTTYIPQFEYDYNAAVVDSLKAMGITDAFDPDHADFSGIGNYQNWPLFITDIVHETTIAVDGLGTRAGAATVIQWEAMGIHLPGEKTVRLDRPFVYMIVDLQKGVPIFIGTVTNPRA